MTTSSEPDPTQPKKPQSRKKQVNRPTDLQTVIDSKDLRFESREDPQERRSRLSIKEAQAQHELWRDRIMIYACLVALSVLGMVSLVFLLVPGQTTESRTWAAASLSAIVSGVVNYSLGRAGKAS
jgi:hypothetical protein